MVVPSKYDLKVKRKYNYSAVLCFFDTMALLDQRNILRDWLFFRTRYLLAGTQFSRSYNIAITLGSPSSASPTTLLENAQGFPVNCQRHGPIHEGVDETRAADQVQFHHCDINRDLAVSLVFTCTVSTLYSVHIRQNRGGGFNRCSPQNAVLRSRCYAK